MVPRATPARVHRRRDAARSAARTQFRREQDILDVWWDSGVSWAAVARARRRSACRWTSTSRAPTSTAAGSTPRSSPRWRSRGAAPYRGRAHPRLRARRPGPRDVEEPRQRRRAARRSSRSTAPTCSGCGSRRRDYRDDVRDLATRSSPASPRATARSATPSATRSATSTASTRRSDAVPVEELEPLDRWALARLAAWDEKVKGGVRGLRVPPRLPRDDPALRGGALGALLRHPEGPALHVRARTAKPRR